MITIFTWLLLYVLPLLFLLAVLLKMFLDWKAAREKNEVSRIPTEPIVLMALGFAFLWINAKFVSIVARVAEEQMRMVHPEISFNVVDLAFGLAAIVLMGSFAKAAWTHLNLEEGKWGTIENYRDRIWPNKLLSAVEFWLRVLIAVVVVLLQKQISGLHSIVRIHDAENWTFTNERDSANFLFSYNHWLAETALWGSAFFFCVVLWLIIAVSYNRHKKYRRSLYGTLSFALPGLLICLCLKYLSTGSIELSTASRGQPDFEMLMILSGIVLVCAFVVTCGMVASLFLAFRRKRVDEPTGALTARPARSPATPE